jgi:curved DNA-binding protein CbpA
MPQSFSPAWLKKFSDAYAVLGVSVSADEQRTLKRYRNIAKVLHPDLYAVSEQLEGELAEALLSKLVNPAYEKLKQETKRRETLATLRFQARRQNQEGSPSPQGDLAKELVKQAASELDVFYEQAVARLAESQYTPLSQFESITQQLTELNQVYLQLKMGNPFVREKRTGLVAAAPTTSMPSSLFPQDPTAVKIDYAFKHYQRAKEYAARELWQEVENELRDAIKIDKEKSQYYALRAYAQWKLNYVKMAGLYCNKALQLNPEDVLALQLAPKLNIANGSTGSNTTIKQARQNGASSAPAPVSQATKAGVAQTSTPPNSPPKTASKAAPKTASAPTPLPKSNGASSPAAPASQITRKPVLIGAAIASIVLVLVGLVAWQYGRASQPVKPTSSQVPLQSVKVE